LNIVKQLRVLIVFLIFIIICLSGCVDFGLYEQNNELSYHVKRIIPGHRD